jgi:RNA recognition motif. (a.k.a. RRM, RBD, or RNP domain)
MIRILLQNRNHFVVISQQLNFIQSKIAICGSLNHDFTIRSHSFDIRSKTMPAYRRSTSTSTTTTTCYSGLTVFWFAAAATSMWSNPTLSFAFFVPSVLRNHHPQYGSHVQPWKRSNNLHSQLDTSKHSLRSTRMITIRYASGKSYLPPDYTIEDDDDTDNDKADVSLANSSPSLYDDILPTTRSRRSPNAASPLVGTTKFSDDTISSSRRISTDDDDDDDDTDLYESGHRSVHDDRHSKPSKKVKSNRTQNPSSSTSQTKLAARDREGAKKGTLSTSSVENGASWMDRNAQFVTHVGTEAPTSRSPVTSSTNRASVRSGSDVSGSSRLRTRDDTAVENQVSKNDESVRTFREDFRGTRVFVQGLPETCRWQALKDHFRVAGNVVFASVSAGIDTNTGKPKGHGIVQFETTAEARNAIRIMRDNPLDGHTLYVREDIQDEDKSKQLRSPSSSDDDESSDAHIVPKGPTPPTKWKCADPESASEHLDEGTIRTVLQILKARSQARRRRNYEACDAMREELRNQYNVHLDDRLSMWWIGAAPPTVVAKVKSEGRWKDDENDPSTQRHAEPLLSEWRQIFTTKENDACVDPDLVQGLLKQRDIARREKDFSTADGLLEQARTSPSETHLTLRIHDESKTWRMWSDEIPRKPIRNEDEHTNFPLEAPPAEQCITICHQYAPEKVEEVRNLLEKFPGREYAILKKLKQRYMNQ